MLTYFIYDVFTTAPYKGNPLAIVEGAEVLSTAQMQTMAREFNLSETVFVLPPEDPAHTARIRIFTPGYEMPFAGHPTIGTALHLAGDSDLVTLEENAGLVPVTISRTGASISGEFTAPKLPEGRSMTLDTDLVCRATGLSPEDLGPHAPGVWEGGPRFFFVNLASPEALSRVSPSQPVWDQMGQAAGAMAVFFYTPGREADYDSRMFAPRDGIPEDPATGSATAILAGQLLANGAISEGTTDLRLCQGRDMGRESWLDLSIDVTGGAVSQVRVGGSAVRVASGTIAPPA
ncbi:PhzF family phenazine biosynthesis isomerase [Rhodobacterales bacterium HKCCE3408]|nr:PhzF family phenazine biosynthesis isomerase [Rhodobacterales bacterium HKCCE3408]